MPTPDKPIDGLSAAAQLLGHLAHGQQQRSFLLNLLVDQAFDERAESVTEGVDDLVGYFDLHLASPGTIRTCATWFRRPVL